MGPELRARTGPAARRPGPAGCSGGPTQPECHGLCRRRRIPIIGSSSTHRDCCRLIVSVRSAVKL